MKLIKLLTSIVSLSAVAMAQNASIAPLGIQFFDNNGAVLSGGNISTFIGGTSTPIATYTDSTGSNQNTNPVVLDASGRANIWLLPNQVYKFVITTPGGLSVKTIDNLSISVGAASSGQWATLGSNIHSANTGNVGVGCTSPVSKLDVCGTSSGNNYLLRIDDSSNSPGLNFYGSGPVKMGSISADGSSALRVRAGNDATQLIITQGGAFFQDQTIGGTTTLTVSAGGGQGTNHLISVKNNGGSELSYIDQAGRIVSPLFNAATSGGSAFTFQNSNSTFLVDGDGNLTLSGAQHGVGNVQFDGDLNVTGAVTCGSGCSGGGGGGGLPVTDTTAIVKSNGDATKLFKIDASTLIPTGTTITMKIPATNFTPVSIENPDTIVGLKTFTADHVTGNYWNAVNAGSSLVFNSANIQMDGNGNITANAAGATPGVTGGNVNAFGFVNSAIWFGMKPSALAPSVTPGGGYSALTYKGGTSGLHVWLYDTVHTAWSDIDLGSVAGGLTSLNGQTGPAITIAGTANQVNVVTTTNTITLSTPQSIAPASNVTFANVTTGVGGAFNSQAGTAGTSGFLLSNNKFIVDGVGDVSMTGQLNVVGTFTTGSCLSPSAICINNLPFVDTSVNVTAHNLTITGTCTGCASGSVGSISGTANQVLANGTSGAPQTGAVTLTLPQAIGLASAVTFGSITSSGIVTSSVTGSSTAFSVNSLGCSNCFAVDGGGNANFFGRIYPNGGIVMGSWPSGPFFTVLDASRNATFNNLTVQGTCTGCGGAGSGVTSVVGTANEVLANGTSGSGQAGTVTLTLPQAIGTASAVNFASVTTTGTHQSTVAAGIGTAFNVSNALGSPFIVDGNGDISAHGQLNIQGVFTSGSSCPSGTAICIGSSTLVDTSKNITVQNITVAGLCSGILCLANGQSATLQGNLSIGGSGNFFNRTFGGTPNCFGVADGWMGYDTFGLNLWICSGGVARVVGGVTSLSAGSGISVSASTGAVTVSNTGVTSLGGSTGAVNLVAGTGVSIAGTTVSIGQAVGTGNSVTFSNVSANGFTAGGTSVINSSGQWIGNEVVVASGHNIQTGAAYAVTGGFFGQDRTLGISLSLSGGGTCTLFFRGGILYSATGC